MNYKRLIKNQETRFKILNAFRFLPDQLMINLQYFLKLGRKPNLKNPKRFTEKLQWYKLHYRDPLMTQCSDKFAVREYVKSKGLGHILNKLYAVYDNPYELNLDLLPNKFVMKTTNGSGTNYFCKDKTKFPLEEVQQNLNNWMNRNIFTSGREWCYKDINARIIIEEMLEEDNDQFEGINDYKFLCFHGKAKYIVFDVDRFKNHKRNIYDINWNKVDVSTDRPNIDRHVPKPDGLQEMLDVANKLSEDFPFVRVDLYWVENKVYFGELTFYPWTGYVQFSPDEFDYNLGALLNIDKAKLSKGSQ